MDMSTTLTTSNTAPPSDRLKINGELCILHDGRLSFDLLQRLLVTTPAKARQLVADHRHDGDQGPGREGRRCSGSKCLGAGLVRHKAIDGLPVNDICRARAAMLADGAQEDDT